MKLIPMVVTALSAALMLGACASKGDGMTSKLDDAPAKVDAMPAKSDGMLTKSNGILVNSAGMTVYTFDKDVADSGKSVCNGQCIAMWPAVPAGNAAPAAPYSVVTRDDGSKQLAYKGKPLYLHAPDTQAGDRKGDNFKEIWHVVVE